MTLLEILVVLAVMGGMMFLGISTMRSLGKSALRSATVEVAAALRAAHNLSTQSGMHHRLILDLDQQTYQIEACPDPIQLVRAEQEEQRLTEEKVQELMENPDQQKLNTAMQALAAQGGGGAMSAMGGAPQAASPDDALKQAAALAGVRVGATRCGVAMATGGDHRNFEEAPNSHALATHGGKIKVRRVHVQHLKEPVTEGQVSINFFPLGHAEKALLEVADDDGTQFTVLLHGLTGRVEVRDGEVDADKHMRRDAAGDEVEEP